MEKAKMAKEKLEKVKNAIISQIPTKDVNMANSVQGTAGC